MVEAREAVTIRLRRGTTVDAGANERVCPGWHRSDARRTTPPSAPSQRFIIIEGSAFRAQEVMRQHNALHSGPKLSLRNE